MGVELFLFLTPTGEKPYWAYTCSTPILRRYPGPYYFQYISKLPDGVVLDILREYADYPHFGLQDRLTMYPIIYLRIHYFVSILLNSILSYIFNYPSISLSISLSTVLIILLSICLIIYPLIYTWIVDKWLLRSSSQCL